MGNAEYMGRPLRCGPVWRATNYGFDAARMCELLASAFLHTPRGRRNYRPRRGERRYCPANFDVDISATLSLISFFPIVFFVFLGIIRPKQILIPSRTFFPVLPTSRWGRYFSPQQLRCSFTEDKDRHTYQTKKE